MSMLTKAKLKEIIEKYGHGLPGCSEDLFQSDKWQIDAASILNDICEEFDLFDPRKYD